MPHVYSLTHLTGRRRNEDRRTVVLTFEVRRYTLIVVAAAVVVSVLPTLLLAAVVGPWSLVTPAIVMTAAIFLWDWRQRSGMRLRNYQAILDKRRAANGVLYASGSPVPTPELVMHQMVVVPAAPDQVTPAIAPPTRRGGRRRRRAAAKDLLSA